MRVVLIRAEGKVFCSGADLSEATADGMEEGARRIVELQRLIVTMSKPVVTRLHGAVRAGGIGIVAASDIAIAAEDATFALTEVKLGLAAGDHLAHRPPPDEPAGGRADHARRRGVHRRRGGGVRPGHDGGAGGRSSTTRSTRSAPRWPPARPRGCASPSGS